MAYLQEIKITEYAPAVGSIRQPNTIFIVPITDKTCDMYASDNDGIVRATSVQVPVFDSVEEANSSISPTNRFEGKTVIIRKTFSAEVPVLDSEGQPVLDGEGEPILEVKEFENHVQFFWRNGIEDKHLITFSPSIDEVLSSGNRISGGKKIEFLRKEEPLVPPEYWASVSGNMSLYVGKDGTNTIFSNNDFDRPERDEKSFYINTIIGRNSFTRHVENMESNVSVGTGNLKNAISTSSNTALGIQVFEDFRGVAPSEYDYALGNESAFNLGIGFWSGFNLREGGGNLILGTFNSHEKNPELWETLIINSNRRYNRGSRITKRFLNNATEGYSPLIVGKFDEKWLEINGKLKLRPYFNKPKKEGDAVSLANAEVTKQQNIVNRLTARLAVLQTRKDENTGTEFEDDHNKAFTRGEKLLSDAQAELTRAQNFANQPDVPNYVEDAILIADTTNMGEVVMAKKTDFVLDVIREMSPEQLTELKTILGVATEPEPEPEP